MCKLGCCHYTSARRFVPLFTSCWKLNLNKPCYHRMCAIWKKKTQLTCVLNKSNFKRKFKFSCKTKIIQCKDTMCNKGEKICSLGVCTIQYFLGLVSNHLLFQVVEHSDPEQHPAKENPVVTNKGPKQATMPSQQNIRSPFTLWLVNAWWQGCSLTTWYNKVTHWSNIAAHNYKSINMQSQRTWRTHTTACDKPIITHLCLIN